MKEIDGMPFLGQRCGRTIAVFSVLVLIAGLTLHRGGAAVASGTSLVRGLPNDAQRVELAGQLHPLAQQRFDVGAVPVNFSMLELKLVLRRSAAQDAVLQKFLAAQQTPGSPQYHHWLTPTQFGARFGASDRDLQAAKAWLQSHSLKVGELPAGRGLLPFIGTAAQVEAAFKTPIHYFVIDGIKHFANTANPQIPAALLPLVSGIRGLHDFRAKSGASARMTAAPSLSYAFSGGGNYVGPADYAVIYDFVPLYKGGITGAGVTVAISAQSDIDASIATSYWSAFGITRQPASSVAAAAATDPGQTEDGNETEAYLDVEIAGSLAPNAKILVVRDKDVETAFDYAIDQNIAAVVNVSFSACESSLGPANASIHAMFQQATAQGMTMVVSTGDSGIAECDAGMRAEKGDTVVSGLSVNGFASTPYNVAVGGTDFNPLLVQSGDYWNATNSPGTSANAKSYIPEMVWNTSCANPVMAAQYGVTNLLAFCNNATYGTLDLISGGGGGQSSCVDVNSAGTCTAGWALPAWQTGVGGLQGFTTRTIPDVALLANDWLACDQSVTTCAPASAKIFNGTSAAAPAMSAIVALLDQALISSSNADGRQGNVNPTLYRLAATEYGSTQSPNATGLQNCNASNGANVGATCIFNDVTTGSNAQPCTVSSFADSSSRPASTCASASGDTYGIVESNSVMSYPATAGYDLASGLGSLNAANLVQTVAGLNAPSALTASVSGTTVNLNWTASGNATSNNVYEGTASGSEASTPLQSGLTSTSATITGLTAGQTYYFLVTAVTVSGNSLPSDEANATLIPATPSGVATSGNATRVSLSWSASPGANSYSVLQGSSAGGEGSTPVATGLMVTSYSVAAAVGTTDYFQVIAVNQGGSSAPSAEVSGTVLPIAPTNVNATGGNASVSLSWAAGTGATSYDVYEGTGSGTEAGSPVVMSITGTSATVTGLANTTKYYFYVTSINSAGASKPSTEANATTTTPSSGGGGSLAFYDLVLGGLFVLGRFALSRRNRPCS